MPAWLGKLFARSSTPSPALSDRAIARTSEAELQTLTSRGDALLGTGDLAGAAQCYQQVLAQDPLQARTLYKLGFAQKELGLPADAQHALMRAAVVDPSIVDTWYILGEIALSITPPTQATIHFQRCIALDPQFEAAYSYLCQILLAGLRFDEAAALLTKALHYFPDSTQFHFLLGNIHFERKQFAEAAKHLQCVIVMTPDNANAYANLALAFEKLQRPDAGLAAIVRARTLQPDCAEWHLNEGNLLQQCGRNDEAIEILHRALALRDQYAEAHANLGAIYQKTWQLDLAESHYRSAQSLQPGSAEYHFNLGAVLQAKMQFDTAIDAYQATITLNPTHDRARLNLASIYTIQRQFSEAFVQIESVISDTPDHADAHWNKATILLLLGDFTQGWQEFEYRWKTSTWQESQTLTHPQWTGQEDLAGKTILLFVEQGMGDTIQFIRYATELKKRGATIVAEVQPALTRLLTGVTGVDAMYARGTMPYTLPIDYQCALMSLPLALGTQVDTIPNAIPYIHVAEDKVSHWKQQFADLDGPRIGLVWAGNPDHKNDRNRSTSLRTLAPLFDVAGLHFLSLQKEIPQADRHLLDNTAVMQDLSQNLTDYVETAAIIANLDLVISVDTSVAHLAAAMGKPVWMLLPTNPDYRWLLDRSDSPWYPTITLYRQSRIGEWTDVIASICTNLRAQFAQSR
jgi:tetratricopeptide (TPR) repeat protein